MSLFHFFLSIQVRGIYLEIHSPNLDTYSVTDYLNIVGIQGHLITIRQYTLLSMYVIGKLIICL